MRTTARRSLRRQSPTRSALRARPPSRSRVRPSVSGSRRARRSPSSTSLRAPMRSFSGSSSGRAASSVRRCSARVTCSWSASTPISTAKRSPERPGLSEPAAVARDPPSQDSARPSASLDGVRSAVAGVCATTTGGHRRWLRRTRWRRAFSAPRPDRTPGPLAHVVPPRARDGRTRSHCVELAQARPMLLARAIFATEKMKYTRPALVLEVADDPGVSFAP